MKEKHDTVRENCTLIPTSTMSCPAKLIKKTAALVKSMDQMKGDEINEV